MKRQVFFWSLVAAGVAADQITKIFAFSFVGLGRPGVGVIEGFFEIECRLNPGVTFGLFGSHPNVHIVTALAISGVLIYFFYSAPDYTKQAAELPSDTPAPPDPPPPGAVPGKADGTDEPMYWTRWHDGAIGLILSGAIGNVIDRIYLALFDPAWRHARLPEGAAVRDFIKIKVGETLMPQSEGWWPTFNVADAFISCGVALYILLFVAEWRQSRKTPGAAGQKEAGS